MGKYDFFIGLKNFLANKIDSSDFKQVGDEIADVRVNPKDIGKSLILLDFDTEEKLLRTIGVRDDDIHFYQSISNPYSSPNYYSPDEAEQDFLNGYGVWDYLDEDNWDKMKEISIYLMTEPFSPDVKYLEGFAKKLIDTFPRPIGSIMSDYAMERNNEIVNSAEKHINEELKEFFDNFEMKLFRDSILSIEAKKLFDFYLKKGLPHFPATKLLKKYFDEADYNLGGWSDYIWEYSDPNLFDTEGLNRSISSDLDGILEKLEDNSEQTKKFKEMVDRITKKYPLGNIFRLPKDRNKKYEFIVKGFDLKEMKIIISLIWGLKTKTLKLTEENFNHLLYQPELFNFEDVHNL